VKFSKIIALNIDTLNERIWVRKKASLLSIDGGVGEGKTTFAVEIADYVNELHGLPPIEFKKQLALGGEEFIKLLQVCYSEKLPVLIYDEAGDFNKRGSLTRLNALLTRTFETFRAFRVLIILCLPSMGVLDNGLFDKNIPRLLFRCSGRTLKQGNIRAWKLKQMKFIRYYMKKYPVDSADSYKRVYPLFYGHFQDLDSDRSKSLDAYSIAGKLKTLGDAEIKYQGLVCYSDIAKKLMRSLSWVKSHLKDLKVKPVKSYQKRAYFEPAVVDRLMDLIDSQLKR
jgi:hypothetical protein